MFVNIELTHAYTFQVPISATDDISEQPFRLSFSSDHHKVVHWFKSWSVPRNDIYVFGPNWRSGWKSAFSWAEKCSGLVLLILMFLRTVGFIFLIRFFFPSCSQIVLLLLALIAVPWMLLPKPFLLKKQHEQVCFGFSLLVLLVCVCVCRSVEILCYVWLGSLSDNHVSFRGSKASLMRHFQVLMIPLRWTRIMIHMVMRSLSLVRFLCISLYIPLNLCLEQCQIQPPIFVYGL